jgi:streptogramin lyase
MKKLLFVLMIFTVFACKNEKQESKDKASSEHSEDTNAPMDKQEVVEGISLEKIWESDSKLTTAEGVVFDEKRGVYYVSCIGGVPPTKEDGDGFIATLDQRGTILDLTFATGLDAPKGMAVSDGNLYVTDINELVIINIETRSMQRIAIKGAQFLNDVALAPDGSIYFTDTNTNTIYQYAGGLVKEYLQDDRLSNPNGIYVDEETIYVVSYSVGDFNTVDIKSKAITKKAIEAFPGGDGVAPWGGGFVVSNWNGEVYYSNSTWSADKILDTKEAKMNAADIMINPKSGELLIPTFFGNSVAAYKIVNKK